MEAKQVKDLMEAYASVYQENEEVNEDLQQKVGQALDAAAKNPVIQAIGAAIKPVGQGRKTPTKDGNWRPVVAKEETEEVDEATKLAAVARRRAEELGRKRRSTKEYKQGLNRRTGNRERNLYDLSNRQASRDASLETQKMSGDTGAHGQNYADRIDKRDPKKNPKHDANKENINASYEYDLFDYLLEYLVAEGYADTNKAALAIMANMSEEWRESIVEGILGSGTGFLGSTARELGHKGGHDALPWNQNTKYTTKGKLRGPGENVHGEKIQNDPNKSKRTISVTADGRPR